MANDGANLPPAVKRHPHAQSKASKAAADEYEREMQQEEALSDKGKSPVQQEGTGNHAPADKAQPTSQPQDVPQRAQDSSTNAASASDTPAPQGPKKNPSAEYLNSLPIRSVMVAGIRQSGRYDQTTGYVYLDNGTVVHVTKKKTTPKPEEQSETSQDSDSEKDTQSLPEPPRRLTTGADSESQEGGSDQSDLDESQNHMEYGEPERKKKKPGKTKRALIAVLAVVAFGALGFQYIMEGSSPQTELEPNPSQAESGPTTEVEVVQLTQDVIAGTVITEDLIEPYVISAESYNQISLSGVNLYQWDRKDTLLGMYVAKYIPRGQYLSYDSLVAAYEPPQNPFDTASENEYIDIPIELTEKDSSIYVPGAAFNITIRKSTVVESPGNAEEKTVGGIDHTSSVQQSVQIDEYKLVDAVAIDVIAKDGSSLYQTLSALLSIPAGEQEHYLEAHSSDSKFIDSLTPAALRIQASADEIDTLGDLDEDNTECIFELRADKADKSTTEKAEFYANALVLTAKMQDYIPVGGESNDG